MSNYPPGVTGNEPQIAGYYEKIDTREMQCRFRDCEFEGEAEGTLETDLIDIWFHWICPDCGLENTTEIDSDEFLPDEENHDD